MHTLARTFLVCATLLLHDTALLAASERSPSAAASAPAAGAAPRGAAPLSTPRPAVDPLQMLRDKLAARLAAPGSEARSVQVVRLGTGAETGAADPAVKAPTRPRASVAPARKPKAAAPALGWGYEGDTGPERWAALKPEFARCASGSRQSPIDIRDGIRVDLEPVQFDYRASAFRVIDTGHTVQASVAPGSSIEVMGRRYELQQFHFHRPAEERVDGRTFEMAAHLVHRDAEGRLAIVAVLLERGAAHPVVQAVWNNLPLEKGDEVAARLPLDPSLLLPADRRYYTFMGSLTTPPCSEGVLWIVLQQPATLSAEQIDIFARLYPMNARPLQSSAGRLIKQSN